MSALVQRADFRGAIYPPEQSTVLWVDDAACAGHPEPDWWFADKNPDALEAAVNVCETCPVKDACLQTALANEARSSWKNRFGVLGGLLPKQRAKLAGKSIA